MKNTVQTFPYSPLTIRSQGSSRLWSQKENEFHSHFWIYQVSHCCQPLEETSGAVIFVDFCYHGERCHWGETLGALNDLFNNTILSLVVDRLTDSLHKNPCLHANREKKWLDLKPSPSGPTHKDASYSRSTKYMISKWSMHTNDGFALRNWALEEMSMNSVCK